MSVIADPTLSPGLIAKIGARLDEQLDMLEQDIETAEERRCHAEAALKLSQAYVTLCSLVQSRGHRQRE